MTQKKKTGMKLKQEFLNNKGNSWILYTVTALLACISLICIFGEMSGFKDGSHLWIMYLTGCCFCIAGGCTKKAEKQNLFYPVVLVLLLIFVLFFRQQILSGCCLVWNRMGDEVTANTGWVLPEWELQTGMQESSGLIMFSILAGALSALFSCFMNAVLCIGLALVLPALLFIGMLTWGQDVSLQCMLIVLGTAACILVYYGGKENREWKAVTCSWIVLFVLFGVLVPAAVLPEVKTQVADFSQQLHEKVHEYRYETADTFLPEGDLREKPVSGRADKTALIVTTDALETMYLRGFTGAVLEDDVWSPLDTKIYADNEDLLYWLNLNEFYPDAQFEKAAASGKMETYSVSIQNVNACSRYLYVPFSLCQNSYLQAENLNQEGVLADGDRGYTFKTVSGSAGQIEIVLEQLQTADSEEVQKYRKAESAYREFVYEHYLQIPQETADILTELWDETAARYGSVQELTSQQAQECVLDVLDRCFPEAGNTDVNDLPVDEVEGTSYQYATTAVMTLRYFGIPARYAEGYIISEEMAAKAESGESVEVNASCGAAWPEVYQDGIGWIPMALTPGMDGAKQENKDQNKDGETAEAVTKEGEELEETPENTPNEPKSESGSMVTVTKEITSVILKVIFVVLFLLLMLILRRKLLLKKKKGRFVDENQNEAIGWIFADTALRLEKMGFDRKNGSMDTLCEPVGQKFGSEYGEAFRRMIHLNACALFSTRILTEEQRQEILNFHELTIKQLKSNTKWFKRFWMKWIQCLY